MIEHRPSTLAYFRRKRAEFIRKYRTAKYRVTRSDARATALHYGRLIRMMEAA